MSFYRNITVAMAAFVLSTSVFAAEENSNHIQSQQASVQASDVSAQPSVVSTAPSTQPGSVQEQLKVNINKANMKELMAIKGLNRVKAKNIITYRKKHGEFKSLDDLKLVRGFKKMNETDLKAVQAQLAIN